MPQPKMNCCVVGLGYIGLPTAALVSSRNIPVYGVDVSQLVVDKINAGEIHIVEPDLDGLVQRSVRAGMLRAGTRPEPADVFLIAVPTPITDDKKPDLTAVHAATASIAPVLKSGDLVILESTSPVGTTHGIVDMLRLARPDLAIAETDKGDDIVSVAYCPERVLPGRIISELVENDRCIGGVTPLCTARALAFYNQFVKGACVGTNARSAELVKLSENAFRDVNIAFANTLSLVCDKHGIDVWEVIELANRHPRVNVLKPGPGVGGHCIAVDPWFIVHSAPEESALIRTSRIVNDAKPEYVLAQARQALSKLPDTAVLACFGLAFKADIDDLRESPALEIAEKLAHEFGERVLIVEPYIDELPAAFDETGACLVSTEEALDACDAALVLVDHRPFKKVAPALYASKVIIDTRGIWQMPHGAAAKARY